MNMVISHSEKNDEKINDLVEWTQKVKLYCEIRKRHFLIKKTSLN